MLITISRQYGAGGSEVARRVAEALGWSVVDNELVDRVAVLAGLPPEEVARREERLPSFLERLAKTLTVSAPELFPPSGTAVAPPEEASLVKITERVVEEIAAHGRVVMVGRAAPAVLGQTGQAIHVRLVAPVDFRVRIAVERLGVDQDEALRVLLETDQNRERYHREYYGRDWSDPVHFHMVLNTGVLGFDGATEVITGRARALGW